MNTSHYHFATLLHLGLFSFLLFSLGWFASPAHAIRNATTATPFDNGTLAPPERDPPSPGDTLDCFVDLHGSISITPKTINLGQSATLTWNVAVPVGCGAMKVFINGLPVAPGGGRTVHPMANEGYRLHAQFGREKREIGTDAITVILPQNIIIRDKSELLLLLQALEEGGKHIVVENHVEIDLSTFEFITVAGGTTLEGGRTPRQPGPRFYTTTADRRALFSIEGDNVRIAGVRIEGPYQGVWDEGSGNCCSGILITSVVNIDIQNNEIFGWGHAAVEIRDPYDDRINYANRDTVRVHDNYIHHNQRYGGNGYGVALYDGAYALIERNVFDWNRHAISGGDGSDGSGYLAYRNLVLENGGKHRELPWPVGWVYTHQFDMHGQDNCGVGSIFSDSIYNCGTAGEYMNIRYNSFFYTKDNAFKLRGTPTIGADVRDNVFVHLSLFTTAGPTGAIAGALAQTENGLHASNNLVGVNGMNELGTCDFDGDGIIDSFLATGQTWWYSSGADTPWVYLNTSQRRRAEVILGFFDGDNRCDVLVDGVIYPGGKAQTNVLPPRGGVASKSLSN